MRSSSFWKGAVFGALAAAPLFWGLSAVKAQQGTAITVADFHRNSRQYVGTTVSITGLARSIRQETRKVNGEDVPITKLSLYKLDSKGRQDKYYVYVALPTSEFKFMPVDGQMTTIVGQIKWPYEIGAIDER